MATKKGKKSKGVTLSFQEFTSRVEGESAPAAGQNVVYAPKKPVVSSWADEVEEDELITEKERIVLPSGPRASRGPAYDDSVIPKTPPFQINLGNLNYDIDEEDLYKFFRDLDVVELKLPRDRETNRIKGFGFVTFGTRNDLIEALVRNEQMLRGRPVRIALGNDRQGGDRGGMNDRRMGRPPAEDEGVDDWRTVMGSEQGQGGGGGNSGSGGMDRGGMDRDRGGFNRDRGGDRGGGGGGMMDRSEMRGQSYNDYPSRGAGGPRSSDYGQPPPNRRYGNYDEDRGNRRNRYEENAEEEEETVWRGQGQAAAPPQPPAQSRGQDSRGYSNYDEDFVRPATVPRVEEVTVRRRDNNNDDDQREQSRDERSGEPKQRKKLVLAPRSNKEVEVAPVKNYASIFGEAKPVDTTKKLLEIEQKMGEVNVTNVAKGKGTEENQNQHQTDRQEEVKKYRLLRRGGSESEKIVEIPSGNERNLSWRRVGRSGDEEPVVRSNRRASVEEDYGQRDSHSEPEDDRDFKQYNKQQMRGGGRVDSRREQQQPPRDMMRRGEGRGNYNRRGGDYREDRRGEGGGGRGERGEGGGGRRMEHSGGGGRQGQGARGFYPNTTQNRLVDKDGFEYTVSRDGDRYNQPVAPQAAVVVGEKASLQNKFAFLSNSSGEEDNF